MEDNQMSLQEQGIEHKQIPETLAATVRVTLKSRKDLAALLNDLARCIPRESIAGAPFCIMQFVTSIMDGDDAEIGFPVSQPVQAGEIQTRVFPPLQVLSLVHQGPVEEVSATYRKLYGFAGAQGLISDEFVREVYPDWERAEWNEIELQYVLHDWSQLFSANLERVLGQEASRQIPQGVEPLTVESTLDERFAWSKEMMARLDRLASEEAKYDIVSSCAHIFPARQVDKLRAVYEDARSRGDDPIQAVDAVIEFMERDPGWGERPLREGRVIYSTKKPRDAQAHAQAQTDAEKRRAYCFCPIVRNRLDQGMSTTFCYCGSGWFRRQWEGALGKPVRIEIVKSIVKGDDVCQFAIHLPADL
jgi:effector-binding domain-containing protein